jgi:3-oxoacyl-[acyl-carrier protein] reductase
MQIDLTGKVAIVTGGAGQLGRAMVRTLAQCGADVAVHYLSSREMADKLVAELRAMGRKSVAVQADVTKQDDVTKLRDTVCGSLGEVHIVVTNAVAAGPWKPVLEQTHDQYENQFRSSVMQNVLMAQAFVPAMIERGGGRIIAINTECAMQMTATQSAYVAGKRGMDGVLRVLAREIGRHGVTVNQVAPGWTISDRDREAGTQRQPEYEKQVALGRRGTDQDIANAVAFLASDLAAFITGCYLPVTGGAVMPTI